MLVVGVNLGKLMYWGDINFVRLKFVLFGFKYDNRVMSKFLN